MDLGYEQSKCEEALRAAYYNSDRAAEYLIDDNIPNQVPYDIQRLQEQRNLLLQDEKIGDSSISRYSQSEKLLPEEMNSLQTLIDNYQDEYGQELIIQVYMACECDSATTISCLKTIDKTSII